LEFLNSQPYYASKKLLSSRQIFRYAVPARTVTKKALVTTDTNNDITNTHCHHDNFSPGSSDEVEKRRVTVDPQTKPIDLGREFAGRLLSSTLTTANPPLSITQPPN